MEDFVNDKIRERLKHHYHDFTVKQFVEQMNTGKLGSSKAACRIHGKSCKALRAALHCAGPPCTDWSTQWYNHLKRLGPTYLVTLIWMSQRLLIREVCVLHENVAAFDVSLLQMVLGSVYAIFSHVYDAQELGWPSSRKRRITLLVRKDCLLHIVVPWNEFVSSCNRIVGCSWHTYMVANASELSSELQWARQRASSLYQLTDEQLWEALTVEGNAHGICPTELHALYMTSVYSQALNASELRRLFLYIELAKSEGSSLEHLHCYVTQDPIDHPQGSVSTILQTVIKSGGAMWSYTHCRWLTPSELFMSQGFVVDSSISSFQETSFLMRAREGRTRNDLFHQCGNSMNVEVVALGILWSLFLVETSAPIELNSFMRGLLALQRGGRRDGDDSSDSE